MGFIGTIITIAVIGFIGWLLYNIYIIIGWEWSLLVLFFIAGLLFIILMSKETDRR